MRVLRWLQGQKSWKHDFDITGDQKGPPCQVNFMVGFCDLKGNLWAQALFKGPKSRMSSNFSGKKVGQPNKVGIK